MKKLLPLLLALFVLSGCATMLTGVTSATYSNAPLVLAYAGPDVIRDQSSVATLVISGRYGLAVDGVSVKERAGAFNPALRVSQTVNTAAYIVDLLPGVHKLTVTYDAMTGADGSAPTARAEQSVGSGTVSASYGGSLMSWVRTSESTHPFKGGDVYAIGLKMLTISGDVDLYPLDAAGRGSIIESRNKARFADERAE